MADTSRSLYMRGILLSAVGMALLSPDALMIRLVADASAWDIIFYRNLFMGLSLGAYLIIRYRRDLIDTIRRAGWWMVVSTALLSLSNLGFVGAITHTTVANTLVILATLPFISAVFGWILIRERLAGRTWAAIIIAMGGIVLIFADSLGSGGMMGNLFAIGTAVAHGLNLVILRKLAPLDMTPALALSGFGAALIGLPLAAPAAVTGHDLAILAVLGLAIVPVALALYLSGTRYISAAEVGLFALVETVLGPIWVWIGIGEVPAPITLVGGSIVMAAIVINAALALKHPQPTTEPPPCPPA
jgi:drug/metabolite transporter (DMT)-like permease